MADETHARTLHNDYPWTLQPLIASAPMRLISHSSLTLAVSRSQGLGFLGVGTDSSALLELLQSTKSALELSPISKTPAGVVPFGIGFICWGADLNLACQIIKNQSLKPAAIWLFAPMEPKDLGTWTQGMREASDGKSKIWIQVGAVAAALEAASSCKPDVLVIQGSDAGGHGLAHSGSLISLLPECADALAREGYGHIPLVATGGIVDGRGLAAALTLGASGVCMGTRFLASPEAEIKDGYRNDVLRVKDGGVSTARTNVYDKIRGTIGWPEIYNGRGILNYSFWDHEKGMNDGENKRLYEEALRLGDRGWGEKGRITAYAGTGLGLISCIKPAAEIVKEVREESRRISQRLFAPRL